MPEALREVVNALGQEWMSQLFRLYGPDVRFPSTPFEKGVQSLREFYDGTLRRTFEATFALMHIAYGCARIYHEKEERHFWHNFFLDVLQWHVWIANQEDKEFFVEVAFRLWRDPDCFSMTEATRFDDDFLSEIYSHLRGIDPQLVNTSSHYLSYPHQSTPQAFSPSTAPPLMSPIDLELLNLIRIRDKLGEGQVISLCTRYLHGKLSLGMEIILASN